MGSGLFHYWYKLCKWLHMSCGTCAATCTTCTTWAQDCSTIGTSCASGCTCPTGLACQIDPVDGLQYCMLSNVAEGGYCDNHFGVCATGFTCALADSTSFVKTCIVPPTTTTTTTTTRTTTTSTTTTTTTNTTTTTTSTTIS